jgi:CRISPR-associated endonuclease/helicase Cas3
MDEIDFAAAFQVLMGNQPFPWQCALYKRFRTGDFPASCNLPTGLGKTAVIPIWLLALAATPPGKVPRRLVYVVNRRTVVDQATREAEKLRERLPNVPAVAAALRDRCGIKVDDPKWAPLAISTLRGQFADNREWSADPARPAVVVGTVDMIGSRLLFSGYGCGFKSRPLHAGFLGQDVLLVHDEAHLEPAYQCLLVAIEAEQHRCRDFLSFRVMELTATSRGGGEQFGLLADDRHHEVVKRRVEAVKRIKLHSIDDEKKTAERIAELALAHRDSGKAILVFVRTVAAVEKVIDRLKKAKQPFIEQLTGTIRGLERDRLATENGTFARFMPPGDRAPGIALAAGTVYLVCTSAGEVGVNLSADHLVCDLTPFDSMAQRFGRVNRFGDGQARIDVVAPGKVSSEDEYDVRRQRALELLRRLDGDASPAALGRLPVSERQEAFTPAPTILPTSDILFDAWALTSIREPLPGRPPVADWLHGVSGREQPETYVAWREEVERLDPERFSARQLEEILEDYPLKPHELLRDSTSRIRDHLKVIADRSPERKAWVIEPDGEAAVRSLKSLVEKDGDSEPVNLNGRTLLLPPAAGGLGISEGRSEGRLSGETAFQAEYRALYDVADQWRDEDDQPRRGRVWDDDPPPKGMRLVRSIDTRPDTEEGDELAGRRFWRWYVRPRSADDDGSRSSTEEQELQEHQSRAAEYAQTITAALGLAEPVRSAVVVGARHHDAGKARPLWQATIGNRDPSKVLAKSGHRRPPEIRTDYRHEFGSLLDVMSEGAFRGLPEEARELVLHLIAAHHGRARPHFPPEEVFDPGHTGVCAARVAAEVPRRFARLQRQYGRWGLAYLESLVRAVDVLASQPEKGGA